MYNGDTLKHDIALLKLSSSAELNSKVQPVCLPTRSYRNAVGVSATVTGWVRYNHIRKNYKVVTNCILFF